MIDFKRKDVYAEIIERLTQAETDVRHLQTTFELSWISDPPVMTGIEDDIKRKGIISEIVRRLTKLESDVRKLQARG